MKQTYEKAKAKVVLFDNSDVITTSGENGNGCPSNSKGGDCDPHPKGHRRGIGCTNTSGECEGAQFAG